MGLFKKAGKGAAVAGIATAVAGIATAVAGAVSKRLANWSQEKAGQPGQSRLRQWLRRSVAPTGRPLHTRWSDRRSPASSAG